MTDAEAIEMVLAYDGDCRVMAPISPGHVCGVNLRALLSAARAQGRREGRIDAAKCVCAYCRDGWPRHADGRHFLDNGRLIGTCSDEATRILAAKEPGPVSPLRQEKIAETETTVTIRFPDLEPDHAK